MPPYSAPSGRSPSFCHTILRAQKGRCRVATTPQSLANLEIHLISSTKERAPFLAKELRPELHAHMAMVLANLNSPALVINSVEDHAHTLFNMGRTVTLAQVVEDVKKSSSKWIKTQSHRLGKFSWQAGYGAFSVSASNVPKAPRTSMIRRTPPREDVSG